MAAEPTSLFTSGTGLPLPAFTTPTALPSHGPAPPRGLEDRHGPYFLSQSGLFLLISWNPPGREGGGAMKVFFWRFFTEANRLSWRNSACSVPYRTCPYPSAPGRSHQSSGLPGLQREIPSCASPVDGRLASPSGPPPLPREEAPWLPQPVSPLSKPILCTVLGPELGVDLGVNWPPSSVGARCDQVDEVCTHLCQIWS